MGDAEIIPIGTRGRPGRGTGKQPSSAARGLAPNAKAKPRTPAGRGRREAAASRPSPSHRAAASPPSDAPATTRERHPLAGIPTGDWLAAFQYAAKEVFGEQWEPQLAAFLAFLRRRVTGDYVVDEYGFDAEVTERFFIAALRPIADKWFRVEVIGAENIPAEGGALVVSNHSGTIPVDGLMTMTAIHDQTGRHLRPLGADLVFRMPIVSALARKGGATMACNEDAERMLHRRRARRRLARGLQGHRQALLRPLQAAAVRPRRLRVRGAARPAYPSSRWRSSAPRRSTRWSATSPRWPG